VYELVEHRSVVKAFVVVVNVAVAVYLWRLVRGGKRPPAP